MLCALSVFTAGNLFAQTLETLAEQIRSGKSEQKRSALFEIRNRQQEEASRIAVPALKDSDDIVRATAAFSVIYLPKDEAFKALSPNLQDKSEIVRRETASALGKIQNPSAINPLIQTFQKDKSVEVKNACAAALGVLEVIENEELLAKAKENGEYLMNELRKISELKNVRGMGLMIGFDVPDELKDLRKNLLQKHHIFTGEAKPNVIRLLPALNLSKENIDRFLTALKDEINAMKPKAVASNFAQ